MLVVSMAQTKLEEMKEKTTGILFSGSIGNEINYLINRGKTN
jgi:hypothetical protein